MLVDPFLALAAISGQTEHGAFNTHQYVGCSFGFKNSHVTACCLVAAHRGTLFCPRLAEMPRRHPALDARSESQIVEHVLWHFVHFSKNSLSASASQPVDDEWSIEAYGRPPTESEGCVVRLLPDPGRARKQLDRENRCRRCA